MDELIIRDKYKVVSGKDFSCEACGACCRIYSLVDIHITDIFRMSEKLGIAPKEFFEKYVKVIEKDGAHTFAMNIEGGCKFQMDKKMHHLRSPLRLLRLLPQQPLLLRPLQGTEKRAYSTKPRVLGPQTTGQPHSHT